MSGKWLLAVVLMLLLATGPSRADGYPPMNIDTHLAEEITKSRGSARQFPVIITLQRADDLKVLLERGIRSTSVIPSIAAVAATLTSEEIESLAKLPQVKLIELDHEAHALDSR
jgi:hypothetical protein